MIQILSEKIRLSLILVVLSFLCSFNVAAQKGILKKADEAFINYDYKNAIELYKKVLKKNSDNADALVRIADCYRMINKFDKAQFYYDKALKNGDFEPEHIYSYAESLLRTKDYEKAKKWFTSYSKVNPKDKRAKRYLKVIDNRDDLLKDSLQYKVELLSANSFLSDQQARIQNNKIYFLEIKGSKNDDSDAPMTKTTSIKSASAFNGKITDEVKFDVIHRDNLEGVYILNNGKTIYYSNGKIQPALIGEDKEVKVNNHVLLNSGVISDGKIDKSEILPFVKSSWYYSDPYLSADGRSLYFSSDMPGGEGGMDIYVSYLNSGEWSEPVNLGEKVNTEGNEISPVLHASGTLFFASDGQGGLGGYDIFSSEYVGAGFSNVKPMPYPINTASDDFDYDLTKDGNSAFFTSNRKGKGKEDIYSINYNESVDRLVKVYGRVIDDVNERPIYDAVVKLYEGSEEVEIKNTDINGQFVFEVLTNKDYQIFGSKTEYSQEKFDLNTAIAEEESKIVAYLRLKNLNEPEVENEVEELALKSEKEEIVEEEKPEVKRPVVEEKEETENDVLSSVIEESKSEKREKEKAAKKAKEREEEIARKKQKEAERLAKETEEKEAAMAKKAEEDEKARLAAEKIKKEEEERELKEAAEEAKLAEAKRLKEAAEQKAKEEALAREAASIKKAEEKSAARKAGKNEFNFKGLVLQEDNEPIANASLSVYDHQTGNESDVITDENGVFEFIIKKNVPYSVTAEKENYTSKKKDFKLKKAQKKNDFFIVELKPSQVEEEIIVMKEEEPEAEDLKSEDLKSEDLKSEDVKVETEIIEEATPEISKVAEETVPSSSMFESSDEKDDVKVISNYSDAVTNRPGTIENTSSTVIEEKLVQPATTVIENSTNSYSNSGGTVTYESENSTNSYIDNSSTRVISTEPYSESTGNSSTYSSPSQNTTTYETTTYPSSTGTVVYSEPVTNTYSGSSTTTYSSTPVTTYSEPITYSEPVSTTTYSEPVTTTYTEPANSNFKYVNKDANVYTVNDLNFKVQIGAFSKPKSYNGSYLTNAQAIDFLSEEVGSDGLYKYMIGQTSTLKDAKKLKNRLTAAGYDGFIVAYHQGVRISIKRAYELMANN